MTGRHPKPRTSRRKRTPATAAPRPVTAAELRALRRELERRLKPGQDVATRRTPRKKKVGEAPLRWNPDSREVQRSVAQLVLTIVEFVRRLMERQAIRRMDEKTLTPKEVEAVGRALMQLERTIREIGKQFGLTPEDLNLDLGPLGPLM